MRHIGQGRPIGSARHLRIAALATGLMIVVGACSVLPNPPPYPYWGGYLTKQGVINKAQDTSTKLEQYVKDWMAGTKPAAIPRDMIPDGVDPLIKNFVLQRPDQVDPAKQWVERPAKPINWAGSPGLFPDPHATYYVMPYFYAPFGSKAVVTGQFPRARFFDIQVTKAFEPSSYKNNSYFGEPEVTILDADINPDAGSTNPFRVGANRNATNRNYTVTVDLKVGDSTKLDPAFKPPYWRGPGNTRVGGAMAYQGPWGDPLYPELSPLATKHGLFDVGQLWIRTYAPDKAAGPRGGVSLPKVMYQLPDGRQFFIAADFSGWGNKANQAIPVHSTSPGEPGNDQTAEVGWYKMWGIMRTGLGFYQRMYDPWGLQAGPDYVRRLDRGVTGRAEDLPAPNNYEPSATLATNINYFARTMTLGSGKVIIISGKLPTTPRTRNGEATMPAAQQRYWSITGYDVTLDVLDTSKPFGMAVNTLMDDEVVTDAGGNFVIVYSRAADRPRNATAANGVTWVDWGPTATQEWLVRYMSVGPEWTFDKAPTSNNLGRETDPASTRFNPSVISRNNRNGFMGQYQPVLGYATKAQFEAISGRVTPTNVPVWR